MSLEEMAKLAPLVTASIALGALVVAVIPSKRKSQWLESGLRSTCSSKQRWIRKCLLRIAATLQPSIS